MSELVSQPAVLVLDEKDIRQAINIALRPEGIRVLAAYDVASAMRILGSTPSI